MRARRFAVGLVGVGVLAWSLGASAQSKGKVWKPKTPPASAKPTTSSQETKPDAPKAEPAAPPEGAPAAASSTPSSATAGDDLGAPPPKASSDAPAARRSPLTPEPNEFPQGAPKPAPVAYDKLLADIAALRGRVAAVTTTLFSSKLRVLVGVEGDDARVAAFRVTLDDGVVYSASDRLGGSEPLVVYDHAVAPGHHMLGVEIERYDARNREYRTFQTSKFSVVVPESKRLEASVRIDDDSDMGSDFPKGEDGEYDLRVRLRAQVVR